MSKPTLVLCPGAWHSSDCFGLVTPKLEAAGHKVVAVDWPSVTRPAEIRSFDDDIAHLSSVLAAEADAGNDIAIVSHSWSGAPVNSAAGAFAKAERVKAGKTGGVVKLIFIAAFVVPIGVSLWDAVGHEIPPLWNIQSDVVYANNGEEAFYNDLPAAEQKLWASKLKGHAKATKYDKTRGAAYLTIPSWYLQCSQDQAIQPPIQAGLVKDLMDQGADVKTETINSGHSPFLSRPDETVDFILRAASS